MADVIVGAKIVVGSNAAEAVGSLRKQLKEAQAEVTALSDKFGATSEQAVKAAKRAAELKDRIGDAKALTDAFNPDRKFQAFASALTGVVGGISAVQGAMGLLGVENEAVEKTLLKVNSAMALSQGLNSILEARDSFKNLGAVIQSTAIFQKANNAATTIAIALQKAFGVATVQTSVAFRVLKGAIAATGIGLLVVGLTTLIGKIQEWTSASDKAAEAQKKLASQTDLVNAKLNNEISVLTSLGGKEDEIYKKKVEIANNELNVLRNKINTKQKLTDEEIKQFGQLKTQLITLELDEKNRIKKINDDAQKEKDKKDKEASEKAISAAKERNEFLRQRNNENIEFQIASTEQTKKIVEDNLKFISDREKQFGEIRTQSAKNLEDRIKGVVTQSLTDRITLTNELLISERDREIASIEAQFQRKYELIKGNAAAEAALVEQYENIKKNLRINALNNELTNYASAANSISQLLGQSTAAGKAFAIAEATINTYKAASQVFAAPVPGVAPVSLGVKIATMIAAIATGIKNVKSIVATKAPGVPSGTTPQTPSISSIAPILPPVQQAQLTQLDQGTINRLGSATNRAYVVESDITNSQERIRRINRAARLN